MFEHMEKRETQLKYSLKLCSKSNLITSHIQCNYVDFFGAQNEFHFIWSIQAIAQWHYTYERSMYLVFFWSTDQFVCIRSHFPIDSKCMQFCWLVSRDWFFLFCACFSNDFIFLQPHSLNTHISTKITTFHLYFFSLF